MSVRSELEFRRSFIKSSGAVGKVTFLEILRDKVLYNVLLCAILLFGLGMAVSWLMYARPERVVLDFGHSAVSLSSAMLAILLSSGMLAREFERRTVHVALSRPISRSQFVVGKFLGVAGIITLNWLLLVLAYAGILAFVGGAGTIGATWSDAVLLVLMQGWVLAALTLMFSTFATASLSVVFSMGFYLIGHNVTQLYAVIGKMPSSSTRNALEFLAQFIPNLQHFHLGTQLTYDMPVPASTLAGSLLYGTVWIGVLLLMAGVLIRTKEL